ncbi:MAG: UDP-N-acetylmuramoyl-L-alanyl-D-glutamate--2,6-diaminopimelate ligase [Candidatus Thiodiazotropha sp.]
MMVVAQEAEMLQLSNLLDGLVKVEPSMDREIGGLCLDSRTLAAGELFLACAGHQQHGLVFAEQAAAKGAVAIIWEPDDAEGSQLAADLAKLSLPMIALPGLSHFVSLIAGRFYAHPSRGMNLFGITGTNGKTSICLLLAHALQTDKPCGMIGTLGAGLPQQLNATGMTTPDAVTLQRLLADLKAQGAEAVTMEVSSHALDQGRVNALAFDCAIFTNLSRDHFDYHGTLENYTAAKRRLFQLSGVGCAVINLDDPFGQELARSLPDEVSVLGYAIDSKTLRPDRLKSWVWAKEVVSTPQGLRITVATPEEEVVLSSRLLGRFNASNLLAVLSVLLHLGWPLQKAIKTLAELPTVPGRMELLGGRDKPAVVVDYAHTPDALEKALHSLRVHCSGRLIVVFGCGGDRDQGKRPIMGEVAARLADICYLTDDNPRSELSALIIDQILLGMPKSAPVWVVPDRGRAIQQAVANADSGDMILVAGKGHEDYQLVRDQVKHFDDREVATAALNAWGESTDE